jgi:hypothetical protein
MLQTTKNEQATTPEKIDWDAVGFDGGFRYVMRDPNYSIGARLLYALICSFATGRYGCCVGNERLARYIGCTVRTIQIYIKELVKREAISVELSTDRRQRKITIVAGVCINRQGAKHEASFAHTPKPISPQYEEGFIPGIETGIDNRNTNTAPVGATFGVDKLKEEQFKRFHEAYDKKARHGNGRDAIRKEWKKSLGRGNDPERIIAAVLAKKKRLEAYRANPHRAEFEPNFAYPVKFLRNDQWRMVLIDAAKAEPTSEAYNLEKRYPRIASSFLHDLRRMKATEAELTELNRNWEYWKARRLSEDGITDQKLLEEVRAAVSGKG